MALFYRVAEKMIYNARKINKSKYEVKKILRKKYCAAKKSGITVNEKSYYLANLHLNNQYFLTKVTSLTREFTKFLSFDIWCPKASRIQNIASKVLVRRKARGGVYNMLQKKSIVKC